VRRSCAARAFALVVVLGLASACSGNAKRTTLAASDEAANQRNSLAGSDEAASRIGDPAAYLVAPGESFDIRLAANPSTGFSWELGAPLDEAVVRSVGTAYVPKEGGAVGGAGTARWTFEGVAPGRTTIVLVYRRPWEPEVAPARVAVYSVAVD
jgi:predicted secreted protein